MRLSLPSFEEITAPWSHPPGWAVPEGVQVTIYGELAGDLQIENLTAAQALVNWQGHSTLDVQVANGSKGELLAADPTPVLDASGSVLVGPGNNFSSFSAGTVLLAGWSGGASAVDPFSPFAVALTPGDIFSLGGFSADGKVSSVGGTLRQSGYVQVEYTFSAPELLNPGLALGATLGGLVLWRRRRR